MKTRGRHMATSSLMKMGSSKQSDDVPCAKEVLQAANRRSSRQHGRADLGAVVPYPIEWCGSCLWRVVVSEEAGFPSLRVAPTRFSAGVPSKCQRMRVRQAVVFSLFRIFHLFTHCDSFLVLCLHHSLGLYIAHFISSPPNINRCH